MSVMTRWHTKRMPDRSARAVIAVTLLALLLVAAVPVALLVSGGRARIVGTYSSS